MDRWLAIGLLLVGVAGTIRHPPSLPEWAVPGACALLDVLIGVASPDATWQSVRPLLPPVAFLLSAVPLAVMLDKLGFFSALASRVTDRGAGPGYLWTLAAVVTTVLNLDAGVVLLTPLYVRVARHRGWDVVGLAAQPVLLACLASSALPVSNLTNLIVVSWSGATTAQFLVHLALPSLVATIVGWAFYRGTVGSARPEAGHVQAGAVPLGRGDPPEGELRSGAPRSPAQGFDRSPAARRAAPLGGAVVLAVLVGFTCGPLVGVQPWMVALGADAVLVFLLWHEGREGDGPGWPAQVPWQSVPGGTAVIVLALGALATRAARYLPIGSLLGGSGVIDLARDTGLAALGANVVNNLPALLVALPHLGHHTPPSLWAVLLGVDVGPVVLVTGSLASLLWLSTLRRLGVAVGPRDFTRFGLRVGLPAAAAALATALVLRAAGLH